MDAQTGIAAQFTKWGLITPSGADQEAPVSQPSTKKRRGSVDEPVVLKLGRAGSHRSAGSSLNRATVAQCS